MHLALKKLFALLAAFEFIIVLLTSVIPAAGFASSGLQFTPSNAVDIGQTMTVNMIVSGGSGGPYSGALTWLGQSNSANQVLDDVAVSTLTDTTNFINDPYVVAFNPQGNLAYVEQNLCSICNIEVVNVIMNKVMNTITVGTDPYGFAFNPSGTLAYVPIYTAAGDSGTPGQIKVINVASNTITGTIPVGYRPYIVAFNPQGTIAYVTNFQSGTANVISTGSSLPINTIIGLSEPYGVAFTPDGTKVYIANYGSDTVNVINVATNTLSQTITISGATNLRFVSFNPSGSLAYVTGLSGGLGAVFVINTITYSVVNTIATGGTPKTIAVSPSGTLAYTEDPSASGFIDVINLLTNSIIKSLSLSGDAYGGLAMNPAGNTIYATNGETALTEVGNLPETSVQTLNTVLVNNGQMQIAVNAVSSNILTFTFNGVKYTENTGPSNTIYGPWSIYGFAQDNGTSVYYYGSNSLLFSNTIMVGTDPTIGLLPTSCTINTGQGVTFTNTVVGGQTPYSFTYNVFQFGVPAQTGNYAISANKITFNQAGTYNVMEYVTDYASFTANSANSVITVNTVPSIALSNNIASNSIDVVIGSASDNALVTATCPSGDTCAICNAAGTSVATSTTGTVTLAYNTLPLGYSALYANDITESTKSGSVYADRVSIVNSVAVTFINAQSAAIPADSQLTISFNALRYTPWESGTLGNMALYFPNGTVAYSWLEGNILNEQQTTGLNTVANTILWMQSPNSAYFLPANSGTATTNTAYIGFDILSNTLFDGNFIGEAPQLSGTYAHYDNGNSIFGFYDNFITLTGKWTNEGSGTITTSDGITMSSGTTPSGIMSSSYTAWSGNALDAYGTIPVMSGSGWWNVGFWTYTPLGTFIQAGSTILGQQYTGSGSNYMNSGNLATVTTTGVWTVEAASTSTSYYQLNYAGTQTVSADAPTYPQPVSMGTASGSAPTSSLGPFYWVRVRAYLPNGVMPAESMNPIGPYSQVSIGAPTPSTQTVTQGQSATINDVGLSGGLPSYSYQWYAAYGAAPTATAANAAEANTLLGTGTTSGEAQSQNAVFQTSSGTSTGSYWFSLYGTDSEPLSVNTIAAEVTVNALPASTTSSSTSSPGGGGATNTEFIISDNIGSAAPSTGPVFTVNGNGYYQNQLPDTLQTSSMYKTVSFACSVTVGSQTYLYQNDVYGIGDISCGNAHIIDVGSIEVIYALPASTSTTSTTTTSSTTAATSVTTTSTSTTSTTTTIPGAAANTTEQVKKMVVNASESAPVMVAFPAYNMTLEIKTTDVQKKPINISVAKVSTMVAAPPNYTKIFAFYLNASPAMNTSINVTLEYNCKYNPEVVPFVFENGTWVQVYDAVLLQNPCRITFYSPNDRTVGIFEGTAPSAPTTSGAHTFRVEALVILSGAVVATVAAVALLRRRHERDGKIQSGRIRNSR